MNEPIQNPGIRHEGWKNLWIAGGITFIVMLFTALVLGAQYQVNDDYAMTLGVAGAYGTPSELMIFTNTLLGIMLKALYTAAPLINWYFWMHFFVLFLAGTAFLFLVLETVPGRLRFLIAVLFAGTAILPDILFMQFTMQAYYCLIAGFGLFTCALLRPELKERRAKCAAMLVLAALFCLLGVMIREMTALTIAPFFLAVVGYRLYKKDWRPVVWLALTCVLCGAAVWVDANAYQSKEWQDYFEYNSARAALLDLPKLDYDDNKEVFDAVGWTENDYDMFYQWYLADNETFSTQNLQYIKDHALWSTATVPSVVSGIVGGMDSVLLFFPFGILALCLGLCFITRRKYILPALAAAAVLLMHAGFVIFQRAPIRTVYPHYVLGILILLLLIDFTGYRPVLKKRDVKPPSGRTNAFATGLLGAFLAAVLLMNVVLADARAWGSTDRYADVKQLDEYIADHKDQLFLSSVRAASDRYGAYSVFEAPRKGMYENFIILGGWNTNTPRNKEFMKEHGIENLFLSLLDDDEYLVEIGEPTLVQRYLQEKFQIQTRAVLIAQFDRLSVYRIVAS